MTEIDWTDPEAIISAELEPGEQLLWAGRPRQGLVIRSNDLITFVLGLALIGLAIFMAAGGKNNGPPLPPQATVLFLCFGALLMFGPPIADIRRRDRIAYGVTSERVLFVSARDGSQVRSLELDSMVDARLALRGRSGGGVIRFGCNARQSDRALQTLESWAAPHESFELERDAQAVFRLIDRALRGPCHNPNHVSVRRAPSVELPATWERPDDVVAAELQPGEVLLWSGRPRHGMIWSWYEFVGAAVVFIWMNAMFFGGGAGNQQIGVGVVWMLVGFKVVHLSFHLGRALVAARTRSRTAYGVTTSRVVVVTAPVTRHAMSIPLDALAEVTLMENGTSGGGTILVGLDVPRRANQAQLIRMGGTPPGMLRFDLPADARLVYRVIRRARRPVEQIV